MILLSNRRSVTATAALIVVVLLMPRLAHGQSQLRTELLWREADAVASGLRQVVVVSEDTLYLLDHARGTVTKTIAGAKSVPVPVAGEMSIQSPEVRWFGVGSVDGSPWVWEHKSREVRVQRGFSYPTLRFLKPPAMSRAMAPAVPRAILPHGHILYEELISANTLSAIEEYGRLIFVADTLGVILDTLAILHQPDVGLALRTDQGSVNAMQPWAYLDVAAVSPSGHRLVVVRQSDLRTSISNSFEVEFHDVAHRISASYRMPYTPVPLSDSLISAFLTSGATGRFIGLFADTVLARQVVNEKVYRPKHLPPVKRVLVGFDGTAALLRNVRGNGEVWLWVDADGIPLGEVFLPPGTKVDAMSRNSLWATIQQSDGTSYVAQYRIY